MLPRTIESRLVQWLINYDSTNNIHNQTHAYLTQRLLKGVNWKYGKLYGDIYEPDPAYLSAMYSQRSIQPLVQRFLNPPEMITCRILCERRAPGNEDSLIYGSEIAWVVSRPVLDGLCQRLIHYLDRCAFNLYLNDMTALIVFKVRIYNSASAFDII